MKKTLLLMLVLVAFVGTVVAQIDYPADSKLYIDHSDKTKDFDNYDQMHGDKCTDNCYYDNSGKKCCDKCCEKCFVFVKCEYCGEEHRCDSKCDKCGENSRVYEMCPRCGAQYPVEMADDHCDKCGSECNWYKKCDKCGSEYFGNGYCEKCGGKCRFDKCCYTFCDKYCYEYMDKCKEHCPSCDKPEKKCDTCQGNEDYPKTMIDYGSIKPKAPTHA